MSEIRVTDAEHTKKKETFKNVQYPLKKPQRFLVPKVQSIWGKNSQVFNLVGCFHLKSCPNRCVHMFSF